MDHFTDRLRGSTSFWDLRYVDREMKSGKEEILDLFASALDPREPDDLGLPLLPKSGERPSVSCNGIPGFAARLDEATHGLLRHLQGIPGLVFAGGAVIGCLTNQPFGDVDVFLTGDHAEAESKLRSIFEAVKTTAKIFEPKPRFLVLRSAHAVSIFTCKGGGRIGAPIQVVLSVYQNELELLSDFLSCPKSHNFCPSRFVEKTYISSRRNHAKAISIWIAVHSPTWTGRSARLAFHICL